jgi:hypothetical protein
MVAATAEARASDSADRTWVLPALLALTLALLPGSPVVAHGVRVTVVLGEQVATAPGPGYLGYTMDYWNASAGDNWLNGSSVLTFPVDDIPLQTLTRALAPVHHTHTHDLTSRSPADIDVGGPGAGAGASASARPHSTFRIGGSSADWTDYEVGGKVCSGSPARNCITMERWLAVLNWSVVIKHVIRHGSMAPWLHWFKTAGIITSVQNGARNGDVRCVFQPAPECWVKNTS